MITIAIASLAGTLIAAMAPAASIRADAPLAASVASTTVETPTIVAAANPKPKRYCFEETFTGSRIPSRVCKTRDAWLEMGIDPLKK